MFCTLYKFYVLIKKCNFTTTSTLSFLLRSLTLKINDIASSFLSGKIPFLYYSVKRTGQCQTTLPIIPRRMCFLFYGSNVTRVDCQHVRWPRIIGKMLLGGEKYRYFVKVPLLLFVLNHYRVVLRA